MTGDSADIDRGWTPAPPAPYPPASTGSDDDWVEDPYTGERIRRSLFEQRRRARYGAGR